MSYMSCCARTGATATTTTDAATANTRASMGSSKKSRLQLNATALHERRQKSHEVRSPSQRAGVEDPISPAAKWLNPAALYQRAKLARHDLADGPELLRQPLLRRAERDRRPLRRTRAEKFDQSRLDAARGALVEPLDERAHTVG